MLPSVPLQPVATIESSEKKLSRTRAQPPAGFQARGRSSGQYITRVCRHLPWKRFLALGRQCMANCAAATLETAPLSALEAKPWLCCKLHGKTAHGCTSYICVESTCVLVSAFVGETSSNRAGETGAQWQSALDDACMTAWQGGIAQPNYRAERHCYKIRRAPITLAVAT